ncbi:MAG: DUF192 domain-containing protein [Candidatus Paceibacterota bacterium]
MKMSNTDQYSENERSLQKYICYTGSTMQRRYISLLITSIILVLAVAALWIFMPTLFGTGQSDEPIASSGKYVAWEYGDSCFVLTVADTLTLRRQGLSESEPLVRNTGMLFLYDLPGEYGFWMKDMNFAIDIIWLDKNDQVVTIESRVSPNSYPHVFYPDGNAKKVIEISAGVAEQLEVKQGDQLWLSAPTTTPAIDCAVL